MSRSSLKLFISDADVSLVQMALARELHDRKQAFQNLQAQGHVAVVTSEKPAHITVRIEDEFIDDERTRFPTTMLMARLQLAVAAGRSCRNLLPPVVAAIGPIGPTGPPGRVQRLDRSEVRAFGFVGDTHFAQFMEPKPAGKKRVTAAVKKFAKGIRP